MVRIDIEKNLAEKLERYGEKKGFKTLSATVTHILTIFLEEVENKKKTKQLTL